MINGAIFTPAGPWALLAGQARYLQMGRRFRRGGATMEPMQLAILLAVLAALVAIVWLVSRYWSWRTARRAHSPAALFAELCRAHGLNWSNRRLLLALARCHRLSDPNLLFVEPHRFDLANAGGPLGTRQSELSALRDRLFAASNNESE